MKVVIVGAGYTGIQLAKSLSDEKADVVLVDNSPERVRIARNSIDCTVVQAPGNDLRTLERDAGIADADALVMLTEDDETNIVACSLVNMRHPGLLKIARVRNETYYAACAGVPSPFGINVMLNPDSEAADAIVRAVDFGVVGNIVDLGGGFCITEFSISAESGLHGLTLKEVAVMPGWRGLAAYLKNGDSATIPSGDTKLKADDKIGIVSSAADIGELSRFTSGKGSSSPKRIVVLGAGRIGSIIVEKLLDARAAEGPLKAIMRKFSSNAEIFLVDADERNCREAKERFAGIRVMCGDISDKDFVCDEGLDACDLMIAVSPSFDRNLVSAAYLKSLGVPKTIALTESSEFDDVARKLGIDVAVPMRSTIVDAMLSRLRGPGTSSIHTVCDGRFEIVSRTVSPQSPLVGKKLREVPAMHGECLLLLVRHSGETSYEVPHGEYEILGNDKVVFIARSDDRKLPAMFEGEGKGE